MVNCILGAIFICSCIFYLELQQKRLVSPIIKLRGFLKIPKVELHIVPEFSL